MVKLQQKILVYSIFLKQIFLTINDVYKIPFGFYKNREKCSDFDKIGNIFFNIMYMNLSIGTPPQKVPLEINMNNQIFTLYNQVYNNSKSITYKEISKYNNTNENEFISSGFNSMDFLNINDKKEKINFILSTEIKYENFPFGMIGLSIPNNFESEEYPFFNSLKQANIINSYSWTLKYFNNISLIDTLYEKEIIGEFIFGDDPHNYEKDKSKYNKSHLIKINPISSYNFAWEINFDEIYLLFPDNKNNNDKDNQTSQRIKINLNGRTKLMPETGFIFISKEFNYLIRKKYFEKYLNENICRYNLINNTRYEYIECDYNSSFKLSSFPNICFDHKEFETTFNFTNKDLFIFDKSVNKYKFLMITDKYLYGWIFGSIFLRKYQLIFNQDSKTIGYYKSMNDYFDNEKEEIKKDGIIKYIIFGILIVMSSFLLILLGMFIQIRYFNIIKKIKANELEESFTHDKKEEKTKEENLVEEANKLMIKYNNI